MIWYQRLAQKVEQMKRDLLTGDQHHLRFASPPTDLTRHYTLLPGEIELLEGERSARNCLGWPSGSACSDIPA
jgi:hypothetical protein